MESAAKYEELIGLLGGEEEEKKESSLPRGGPSNEFGGRQTPPPDPARQKHIRALAHRQLGWLYFCSEQLVVSSTPTNKFVPPIQSEQQQQASTVAADPQSLQRAIDHLIKSAQLDTSSQLTWYYLGRVFSCMGEVARREAFLAYKNSIGSSVEPARLMISSTTTTNTTSTDSSSSSASSSMTEMDACDTWCSIGTLYAQQRQHMDALLAFVCAIQLDRRQHVAWHNLAALYEWHQQFAEALTCYKYALKFRLDEAANDADDTQKQQQQQPKRRRRGRPSSSGLVNHRTKRRSGDDEKRQGNDDDEEDEKMESFVRRGVEAVFEHELDAYDGSTVALLLSTDDVDDKTSKMSQHERNELAKLVKRIQLLAAAAHGSKSNDSTVVVVDAGGTSAKQMRLDVHALASVKLPSLSDAFSLQIPVDMRRRLASVKQQQQQQQQPQRHSVAATGGNDYFTFSGSLLPLGVNVNGVNVPLGALPPPPPPPTSSSSSPSSSGASSSATPTLSSSNSNKKSSLTKKLSVGEQPQQQQAACALKPHQVQLMNQLEANKHQLSADQAHMLAFLKSQQQPQHQQQQELSASTCSSSSSSTCIDDLLPLDLENVQPITMMMAEDEDELNSMLHDADLSKLLGASRTTDAMDVDDPAASATKPQQNNTTTTNNNKNSSSASSFARDTIRLDSSLTNGSTTTTTTTTHNGCNAAVNDDELVLASKLQLRITMSGEQVLDACKSFGLNGIQSTCLLRPGRLRRRLLVSPHAFASKSELIAAAAAAAADKSTNDDGDDENVVENLDEKLPYGRLVDDDNDNDGDDDDDEDHLEKTKTSTTSNLRPAAPSVIIETKKDIQSPQLQYFCMSHPISVVRGLASVLRLDLSLFSTRTLCETDGELRVEVRIQRRQSSDENWDAAGQRRVWTCKSTRSYMTLAKYAAYQAQSFQEAVREERQQQQQQLQQKQQPASGGMFNF